MLKNIVVVNYLSDLVFFRGKKTGSLKEIREELIQRIFNQEKQSPQLPHLEISYQFYSENIPFVSE